MVVTWLRRLGSDFLIPFREVHIIIRLKDSTT